MRVVLRGNDVLRSAVARIPGHAEAMERANKVGEIVAASSQIMAEEAEFVRTRDRLIAAATTGALTADSFGEAVDDLTRRTMGANHHQTLIDNVTRSVLGDLSYLVDRGADDARTELHDRLSAVGAAASELGTDDLNSAEEAISAGRVEDYQKLLGMAEQYGQIRSAQADLLTICGEHPSAGDALGQLALIVREPEKAWDEIGPWCHQPGWPGGEWPRWTTQSGEPPWPAPAADPFDWLLWSAANPEAGAWVPTDEERTATVQRLRALGVEHRRPGRRPIVPPARSSLPW